MNKRIAILAGILTVVCLYSSVALALPPLGPARASVGENQWTVGVGYSRSNMDLEATGDQINIVAGTPTNTYSRYEIDGLDSNLILGCLNYGVHDNWDAFVYLGLSDVSDDLQEDPASGTGNRFTGLDGSFSFAWGFGSRVTFVEDADVTWGGLFQVVFSNPDESDVDLEGDPAFNGDAELDFWQVQIAAGPTVQVDDVVSIYGGPFLHFVGGDLDINGVTGGTTLVVSQDIREQSHFGGYLGAEWLVDEGTTANIEAQFTGDAWAVGVGAVWRTE